MGKSKIMKKGKENAKISSGTNFKRNLYQWNCLDLQKRSYAHLIICSKSTLIIVSIENNKRATALDLN
jgi:hypothetical protein